MAFTKVVGPGIHTLSNILSHNINSSGIITATQFDGPFSNVVVGGATTLTVDGINISAGILTAQTLDLNGNGDISGNLVVGGNLTANGDFTTLNTTLREVELLRVDAQDDNVAAGIITQRGTGNILDLYDTGSAVFSVRDGGNIIMGTGAGSVAPHAPLHIRTGTTGAITTLLKLHGPFTSNTGSDGTAIDFGTASDTSTGARIIGTREAAGAKGALRFCTGRENDAGFNGGRMVIDETGSVGIGSTIPLSAMALDVVGSIRYSNQSRGANGTNAEPSYAFYSDHDSGMYRGGTNILSFATAGIKRVTVLADGKVGIGSGTPSGLLDVNKGTQANIQIKTTDSGSINSMVFSIGSSTNQIYSRGANSATARNLIFLQGSTEVLKIDTAGNLILKDTVAQGNSLVNYIQANDVNGAAQYILGQISTGNQDLYLQQTKNANIRFQTSGSTRWKIDGDPGHLLPETAGAVNIGSTSAEIGDVYLADGKSVYLGSGQDVRLLYDSSGSASFTIDSQAGYMYINSDALRLNSRTSSWNYLRGDKSDGVVKLYKSNSERLATSEAGITVTGEVAASQDYPNFRPTLDFNFAAEKVLDPRIRYSRLGSASYVNEFGHVVVVGDNTPRFDHDPITRECKGLLIEETRTNKISNSNGWNDGVVTDETKSPDGEFNAIKVTGSESGTTYNEGTSTTGVWSVFLKAGSTNYVQLQGGGVGMNNSSIGPYTNNTVINLSNGTFTVNQQNFTAEQYRDGWWRVSVVYTTGGTYQGTTWSIYCLDSSSPSADTVDNAEHCYVWGEVYEVGSYITSYIPATGITATRGSDDLIIDGEDLTDFHNQPEGTILADYKVIAGDPDIFYLSNNTASRRIGLYEAGSSQTRFIIGNSGTQTDTTDSAGTTVGDNIKSAGAYKLNDVAASKNGVISGTDTNVTIPDDIDRAYIGGYYDGTVEGVLGLRRLVYYQQRLPNSQLVTLTA